MLEILYKVVWTVICLGIAVGIATLAWVLVRFNLKRRSIRDALSRATPEQISRIIDFIESIGTERPIGGILIQTNNKTDSNAVMNIPMGIADFPWSGRSINMIFDPDLSFEVTDKESDETKYVVQYS